MSLSLFLARGKHTQTQLHSWSVGGGVEGERAAETKGGGVSHDMTHTVTPLRSRVSAPRGAEGPHSGLEGAVLVASAPLSPRAD